MSVRRQDIFKALPTLLRWKTMQKLDVPPAQKDRETLIYKDPVKLECRQFSASPQCSLHSELVGAVCVERYPVITASRTKLHERFANLLSQIELEKSFYSDHEIRLEREKQNAKSTVDDNDSLKEAQTALDLEDKWEKELKSFTPASRLTEDDQLNNRHSLHRRLDTILYLLVKQNINGKDHWVLPQKSWQGGETLRQTAERALASVGGDLKVNFLGNAPCGVAKFDPVKVFFFKAWYRDGLVKLNQDFAKDHLWVTRNELAQFCFPTYSKNIKKFIPPF